MEAKRKKVFITVLAAAAAAAVFAAALGVRLHAGSRSQAPAYVEPVSGMTGGASSGVQNRYSGIVESQEVWEISLSQDQQVKEILVSEGDTVQEGTPLFTYQTEDLKLQLSQAKLEMEEMGNEIGNYNSQIKSLKSEKASAPKEEQFQYTVQIQNLETSIRQSEYNRQSKQIEIDRLQKSLDQATVTSRISGVVKSVKENQTSAEEGGEQQPFLTILAAGDFRVKGMVNETNVWQLSEGQPVLLRSRIDENQIWRGTVQKIDTENAQKGNDASAYSGDPDGETRSSRYPFYVALESGDGLMLGQHLYIEPDEGQTETKEGVWIYSGYLNFDDGAAKTDTGSPDEEESLSAEPETPAGETAWVWADDGKGRLKKCQVELGEYDAELDLYQIVSGLKLTDWIAWPEEGLKEGMKTTTEIADSMDGAGGEELPDEAVTEEGENVSGSGTDIPGGQTQEGME